MVIFHEVCKHHVEIEHFSLISDMLMSFQNHCLAFWTLITHRFEDEKKAIGRKNDECFIASCPNALVSITILKLEAYANECIKMKHHNESQYHCAWYGVLVVSEKELSSRHWRVCRHRHVILHPSSKFSSNRTSDGGVMTSYRILKMAPYSRKSTTGFSDGICLRKWKFIRMPNFDELFQFTAEI